MGKAEEPDRDSLKGDPGSEHVDPPPVEHDKPDKPPAPVKPEAEAEPEIKPEKSPAVPRLVPKQTPAAD